MIVSHDQFFVGRVAKEVWVVNDGAVKRVASFEKYIADAHKKAVGESA